MQLVFEWLKWSKHRKGIPRFSSLFHSVGHADGLQHFIIKKDGSVSKFVQFFPIFKMIFHF